MTAQEKLTAMKEGARVITNDKELEEMLALGDDAIYRVRSIPNPHHAGLLDQYEAWIES